MFIAHLPAGWLFTRWLLTRNRMPVPASHGMAAGLAGAIAPDLDLLYFYLVDAGRHHHHSYATHYPVLWLELLLVAVFLAGRGRGRVVSMARLLGIFSLNALLHLALDSVVGDVRWLAPFSAQAFSLFTVPARYSPWWLNFLWHWSFALELLICAVAVIAFRQSSARGNADKARSAHRGSAAPARAPASGRVGCAAARDRR